MKYFVWLVFGLMLLPGQTANGQEEKEEKAEQAEEKVQASDETPFQILKKEFAEVTKATDKAMKELMKEFQESGDDRPNPELMKKFESFQKEAEANRNEVGEKAKELIETSEPNDESLEMTIWILENVRSEEMQAFAVERVVTHHVKSERMLDVIPALVGGMPSKDNAQALERMIADGANDEIKGTASISLAILLSQVRDMSEQYLEMDEEMLAQFPKPMLDLVKSSAELTEEQIEAMFTDAAEKFGAVRYKKSTIAKFVKNKLKAIEMQKNLQVGKVAPDIEGPDIDGVSFKLSDYRGKVVMLDFWGDW